MTDIEKTEEPQTIDAVKELNVTAEDWGLDLDAVEEPTIEEPEAEEVEDVDGEVEEEIEEVEAAEEEAPEVVDDQPKRRKNTANSRISELTKKLKESVSKEEYNALKLEMDNLKAGLNYLKPKEADAPKKSLDERLVEAAKLVNDPDFDIDDFTTDAEKKAALIGYENRIEATRKSHEIALHSVKSSYDSVIAEYQEKDPDIAKGLTAAYKVLVEDEAIAIARKFKISRKEAFPYAERALLNEALAEPDPIFYLAKSGKEILDERERMRHAAQPLTKHKEPAKIDHKNRETVQQKAGKPEIDTAPVTKRSVEASKRYEQVAAEW